MKPLEIIDVLNEETEGEAVLYPNLEEALIGVCRRFNQPPVALYDYNKCIKILMRDHEEEGEDEEEAYEQCVEHLEFNTLGTWLGDHTPAFAVMEK